MFGLFSCNEKHAKLLVCEIICKLVYTGLGLPNLSPSYLKCHRGILTMTDLLKKLDEETQWEYGLRLIEAKVDGDIDLEWQDLVEILELDCHRDSLRKATNVTDYSGVSVSKYYKQKIEELLSKQNDGECFDDLLNDLQQQKIELQKERVRLADERRQYNSLIRTEARWEALNERIENAITKLPKLNWHTHKNYTTSINDGAIASLLLSDWHIGTLIDTHHNQFNMDIAKERIEKLKQETIKYCKLHNVNQLNINVMGDLVSGVIHITTRLMNQENIVNQTIMCAELLANLINDLAIEIPFIHVNYTIGNHGRVSPSVKESLDTENFEYIVLEFLKLRLKDSNNVFFNKNKVDKEIVLYRVFDKTIACVHGHRERKVYDSVKELSYFLGQKIDMVCCGHFHNFSVKNNVIVNGCLSGSDEYANNLRFNDAPSQTLVIHFENDSQALYEIVLK